MEILVQYYLVDHSLKMRRGKTCAQVAHGAEYAKEFADMARVNAAFSFDRAKNNPETPEEEQELLDRGHRLLSYCGAYNSWVENGRRKVVLKCQPEDLQRGLDEYEYASEVVDAGHTEVAPNTRTVVVLPVMRKEDAPSWVQELKPL